MPKKLHNGHILENWNEDQMGAMHKMCLGPKKLFVLGCDEDGNMKQWLIKDRSLKKDFGMVMEEKITALETSHFEIVSSRGYVGSKNGQIKIFDTESGEEVKTLDNVFEGEVRSIAALGMGTVFFAADDQGNLKKFVADNDYEAEDMGKVLDHGVTQMCITPNGRFLF